MQEIRWGIIGCGDVTEVKSGPAFNKVAQSSLVAVMRRNAEKAADYAKRHGVPRWYSDAAQLINDPEINAVYIATPPLQHEAYTIAALKAGKHVYVEKPMALNAQAAQNMVAAAEQYGAKLSVAHYRRAQPMFLYVKQLLDENAIGDVRLADLRMFQPQQSNIIAKAEENWRMDPAISGGGLFHDLAPHQLDLMLYYFGPVKAFHGISLNQSGQGLVDDLVSGHIEFENGVVFNGSWCFTVAQQQQLDECTIYGSKGKISFPMFGQQVRLTVDGVEKTLAFEALQHVEQPMIEQVTAYFLGQGPNPCSGAEALKTMALLDGFTAKS